MVYVFVKLLVGALLTVDYFFPLLIVLRRRSLWDEPMVLLVTNLCALNFAFGLVLSLIGALDLAWQPSPAVPCAVLMPASVGLAVSVKATHVALALDQYTAVSYPLHYYQRMEGMVWPFLGCSWALAALHMAGGLSANLAGMETAAQFSQRINNGTTTFTGCRWETAIPDWFMMLSEVEVSICALCTSFIFIYAGYVGWREKARMEAARAPSRRDREQPEESHFLANFSAFKRVIRFMFLVITLDCIGLVLRISSRWYPMPLLNGLIHQLRLSMGIIEGWAYGRQNGRMRAAYVEAFSWCCCCVGRLRGGGGRVVPQQQQQDEEEDKAADRRAVNVVTFAGGSEPRLVGDVEPRPRLVDDVECQPRLMTVSATADTSHSRQPAPVTAWPA